MADTGVVSVNGFEMEYFKFGKGGKTFVIIPGLSIQRISPSKEIVEKAYSLVSEDFTAYVFERRKNIPDDYSIYDMADDTAAVMKELGLKDAYVFGASQGGMIAQVLAIRYPALVKKIALGSTSPHVHPGQRAVIDRWIELAEKGDREGLYLEYGKQIFPPEVYAQYTDYFKETAKRVTDEELKKFIILARSIKDFDVSGELEKIACPVLALGVYEDPVLDSDATMEIAVNLDKKPDFLLYMYKGYGHAAFDTAPDYKNRVLDFFLSENTNPMYEKK
ncbi:MAG: alpha/beta hydrolase [Lachnospiraceae bacterium]|nr:alpha/beta hydrolase [Lachnospiraceae bacterium]